MHNHQRVETIIAHCYNQTNLGIHCYTLIYLQRAATYQGSMRNCRVANDFMQASVPWSGPAAKFTDRIWF